MTEWEGYWKKKSCKKAIIELVRKNYFAPLFADIVKKHVVAGPVLEAGCGSCEILSNLAGDFHVTGLDNSKAAVEAARKMYDFPIELGDIYNLPFEDNSFELIYNQGVMEHFSDEEMRQVLSEFARVAKKVVVLIPSNLSAFQIYNPFDVDDARFLSPEKGKQIVSCVFKNVYARYIVKSFFLTLIVYGEND